MLDNIDPDSINGLFDIIDPAKTCFHVITKSGNTVETVTQFMLALRLLQDSIGDDYKEDVYKRQCVRRCAREMRSD